MRVRIEFALEPRVVAHEHLAAGRIERECRTVGKRSLVRLGSSGSL